MINKGFSVAGENIQMIAELFGKNGIPWLNLFEHFEPGGIWKTIWRPATPEWLIKYGDSVTNQWEGIFIRRKRISGRSWSFMIAIFPED